MRLFEFVTEATGTIGHFKGGEKTSYDFRSGGDWVQIDKDSMGKLCGQCHGSGKENIRSDIAQGGAGHAKPNSDANERRICTGCMNSETPGFSKIVNGTLQYDPMANKSWEQFKKNNRSISDWIIDRAKKGSELASTAMEQFWPGENGYIDAALYNKIGQAIVGHNASIAKQKEQTPNIDTANKKISPRRTQWTATEFSEKHPLLYDFLVDRYNNRDGGNSTIVSMRKKAEADGFISREDVKQLYQLRKKLLGMPNYMANREAFKADIENTKSKTDDRNRNTNFNRSIGGGKKYSTNGGGGGSGGYNLSAAKDKTPYIPNFSVKF